MNMLTCNHCGNSDKSTLKWKGDYEIIYSKFKCLNCNRTFTTKQAQTHKRSILTDKEIYELRTEKKLSYREIGIKAVGENVEPLSRQRIQSICKKYKEAQNQC